MNFQEGNANEYAIFRMNQQLEKTVSTTSHYLAAIDEKVSAI